MLKKENMKPGTKLKINHEVVDGLPRVWEVPGEAERPKPHLRIDFEAGSLGGWNVPAHSILEVVKGPRKVGKFNVIRVRSQMNPEIEGEVFWCTARASCKLYQPE